VDTDGILPEAGVDSNGQAIKAAEKAGKAGPPLGLKSSVGTTTNQGLEHGPEEGV